MRIKTLPGHVTFVCRTVLMFGLIAVININVKKDIEIPNLKILNYYFVLYVFSKIVDQNPFVPCCLSKIK